MAYMCLIIFFLSPTSSTLKLLSAPSTSWRCSRLSVFVTLLCKSSHASGSAGKCSRQRKQMVESPIQRTLCLRSLRVHFGPLPLFPGRRRTRGILKKETGFQTPLGLPSSLQEPGVELLLSECRRTKGGRGSFPLFIYHPLKWILKSPHASQKGINEECVLQLKNLIKVSPGHRVCNKNTNLWGDCILRGKRQDVGETVPSHIQAHRWPSSGS